MGSSIQLDQTRVLKAYMRLVCPFKTGKGAVLWATAYWAAVARSTQPVRVAELAVEWFRAPMGPAGDE
jgi:hypothetical protein